VGSVNGSVWFGLHIAELTAFNPTYPNVDWSLMSAYTSWRFTSMPASLSCSLGTWK